MSIYFVNTPLNCFNLESDLKIRYLGSEGPKNKGMGSILALGLRLRKVKVESPYPLSGLFTVQGRAHFL